jgi:ribosomal protein S18 acetylase RimI-like enzyme
MTSWDTQHDMSSVLYGAITRKENVTLMLIPIKHRIAEESIQELLSYSIFPDPKELKNAVIQYQTDPALELYGHVEEDEILGLVGFTLYPDDTLELKHIAVDPECRGIGYGRGLILELIEVKQPSLIRAETDEETVDFYRNVGFAVVSLGEIYPGIERFQCSYDVENADM